MKKLNIKLTFTESLLGTSPADEEIYTRFIGGKAPDAATLPEEVAALGSDAVVERGTTVFPRDEDGNPVVYDYQVKGFFKDACSMLARRKKEKGGQRIRQADGVQEGHRRTDFRAAAKDCVGTAGGQGHYHLPASASCADRTGRAGSLVEQRGSTGGYDLRAYRSAAGREPRESGSRVAGLRSAARHRPVEKQRQGRV